MYLNPFAVQTLTDRYMAPQDTCVEDIFTRAVLAYNTTLGQQRAQRMLQYVKKNWFVPSTPVLANSGTGRGNPIACFLGRVGDSRRAILSNYVETGWLASNGGGVGWDWSQLRTGGTKTSHGSQSNGMVPFMSVGDRLVVAFAQGSSRRASEAVFLDVSHPEIIEFVEMRKPTGKDLNRKNLNLHHGVLLSDEFMLAVLQDKPWYLVDPHTKEIKETVSARGLWERILLTRSETGEPYMIFKDNQNNQRPDILKQLGVQSTTSNLCTEITVAVEMPDGTPATGVCCLGSINLDKWDEYSKDQEQFELFVSDCIAYLWCVLDEFINSGLEGAESARNNAEYYRDVGLGTIGFHSYLQSKMVPFCSPMARSHNQRIFSKLKTAGDKANYQLTKEFGACQASIDAGTPVLCTHWSAIAPNASTSIFADASPGIEPWTANGFIRKTASGTYIERNKYLERLLDSKGMNTEEVWTKIIVDFGTVRSLDFLTDYEKEVFASAYEMDQRWLIQHAADRQPRICQSQSVNLYFPPKTSAEVYNRVHLEAWLKRVKSLYYSKSLPTHKASTGQKVADLVQQTSEEDCLGCAN